MGGDLQMAWDVLVPLIVGGVTFGVTLAVIVAFIHIGWKLFPYVAAGALLVWFLT